MIVKQVKETAAELRDWDEVVVGGYSQNCVVDTQRVKSVRIGWRYGDRVYNNPSTAAKMERVPIEELKRVLIISPVTSIVANKPR